MSRVASCFSPQRAREATGAEIPEKWGKLTKIPLPGPTPENGEKLQKDYKNCISGVSLRLFWGNFPHFRGSDRGGEFLVIFPHFSGISAPVASRAL